MNSGGGGVAYRWWCCLCSGGGGCGGRGCGGGRYRELDGIRDYVCWWCALKGRRNVKETPLVSVTWCSIRPHITRVLGTHQ